MLEVWPPAIIPKLLALQLILAMLQRATRQEVDVTQQRSTVMTTMLAPLVQICSS